MDDVEKAADFAASQIPKEDEIRAKVIVDFGFDAEADKDRIDKLVTKEIDNRKRLSDAIGQKIKHREEAEALRGQLPPKPQVIEKKEDTMSPKDYLALNEAKVSSQDFDEVVRVSKILGKPIHEALADTTLKTILGVRISERASAAATQTKSPRGTEQANGDALIDEASKGNVPEEADIDKLVAAQIERKIKRK